MTALTQVEKESVKPLANREMGSLQRRTAAEQTLGSRLADCLAATPLAQFTAWFEAAVPIGFALVVIRSVQGIVGDWAALREGREPFAGKAMFEE